jgi:hypothetical protein
MPFLFVAQQKAELLTSAHKGGMFNKPEVEWLERRDGVVYFDILIACGIMYKHRQNGANMKENASDAIDSLFTEIRLKLSKMRKSDPATTEELKSLLTQLEDCVEKLVIDSLKLESLSKKTRSTKSQKKTGKRKGTTKDSLP